MEQAKFVTTEEELKDSVNPDMGRVLGELTTKSLETRINIHDAVRITMINMMSSCISSNFVKGSIDLEELMISDDEITQDMINVTMLDSAIVGATMVFIKAVDNAIYSVRGYESFDDCNDYDLSETRVFSVNAEWTVVWNNIRELLRSEEQYIVNLVSEIDPYKFAIKFTDNLRVLEGIC